MDSDSKSLGCSGLLMAIFIGVLFSVPIIAAYESGLAWLFVVAVVAVVAVLVIIISSRTGVEQLIFRLVLAALIITAAGMVRDSMGVGLWAGLPIHILAMALAYLLAV